MNEATIGIVGAGAAGMSLAWILKERGITDVVILEQADRVGGKSLTLDYQGLPHELGTCYTAAGYTRTNRWMKQLGIGQFHLPEHRILRTDGIVQEFSEFVQGGNRLRAYSQVARYIGHWLAFHLEDRSLSPSSRHNREMGQSFSAWLEERGLDAIQRFALRTMTGMGYGDLRETPALNGLRWNTPSLVISGALTTVYEPVPGWQHLWLRMEPKLTVHKNVVTERAERRNGLWHLSTNQGSYRFKHLVITTALDDAGQWIDFGDERKSLFSHFKWRTYVTHLVIAEGWFRDVNTMTIEENVRDAAGARRGHLMVARRTGDKTEAAKNNPNRPDVYVTYQYGGPDLPASVLLEKLRADVAAQGGRITEVLASCPWKYCPTLSYDAIRSGVNEKLHAIQGRDQLWFSGAGFSHESVDNIVDYNAHLADGIEYAIRVADKPPIGRAAFRLLTELRRAADLVHEL